MTANPYSVEPNHRAPSSKCAILRGTHIAALAWVESGKVQITIYPGMHTPDSLRHIADAVDGWTNGG